MNSPNPSQEQEDILETNKKLNSTSNEVSKNIYNPGQWKNIDDNFGDLIVDNGTIRYNDMQYQKDENNRHFSSFYYQKVMPNGEKYYQRRLVYSKDLDKIVLLLL